MADLAANEHVEIAAPATAVWAYRLDFTNLPEYNPDVTGVERVEDGSGPGGVVGAGAHYRFTLTTVHGSHPVTLRVTGAVEGEEVRAAMEGGMSAHETFRVEPIDDQRCRASLTLWIELPATIKSEMADKLLASGRRQIRGELDLMQAVLEARHAG
jgi:uncharacterized membrane protein